MTRVCPRCGGHFEAAAAFCPKDGTPLSATADTDPYVGQVLLGQFHVTEKLGAGGMGTVYKARQVGVERDVAIKILHPELVQNQDAVRRFQREARVSAALDHPNVVRVFLFGQLPDGNLYIVMEHLEGQSLADVLRTTGPMPVPRAIHITTQICAAIGEAHTHGVVHRDVKPENVILVTRGKDPDFAKVLDFGIARFLWGEQTIVTQSGLIFGTARYISPEGAAGEATDARSDVYSLGVLCYQLLCGETPFDSPSPVALLMKHIHEAAPDIRTRAHGAHVPTAVAEVLSRSLAKNPEARWDDAAIFGEALRDAAHTSGFAFGPPARRSSVSMVPDLAPRSPARLDPTPMRVPYPAPVVAPVAEPSSGGLSEVSIAGLPGTGRRKRGGLGVVLLSFALGAAAVGGGAAIARVISQNERAAAVQARRSQLYERANAALAAEAYVAPPGDNVLELTAAVLVRDAHDAEALRLRAEAAHRLVADADRARADGLHDEAHEAYADALRLQPGLEAARAGLDALETATPRVTIALDPPAPSAGEQVTIVVTLAEGVHLEGSPEAHVTRGDRPVRAVPLVAAHDARTYTASTEFSPAGDYVVEVHARAGGDTLHAEAQVRVGPAQVAVHRGGGGRNGGDGQDVVTGGTPVGPTQTVTPIGPAGGGGPDGIDWTAPPPPDGTGGSGTVVQDPPPPPWNGSPI